MISYISGKILAIGDSYVIVEQQGIGYKVFLPLSILNTKQINSEIAVFCYQKFSETEQALFGVTDFPSLRIFELLVSVNGVGPKSALAIVGQYSTNEIQNAILTENAVLFTSVSGIGKKTADRILLELKQKILESDIDRQTLTTKQNLPENSDVSIALKSFGYNPREIAEAVKHGDTTQSIEDQIKAALKYISAH